MLIDQYGDVTRNRYYGFTLSPDDEQDRVIAQWLQSEPHPTRVIKGLLRDALQGKLTLIEHPDGSEQ